jgi:hypothetical protein
MSTRDYVVLSRESITRMSLLLHRMPGGADAAAPACPQHRELLAEMHQHMDR